MKHMWFLAGTLIHVTGILLATASGCPVARANERRSCQLDDSSFLHETCRIDEPYVKQRLTPYTDIRFQAGDQVVVNAGGCVQTGGWGATWKLYVTPEGDNADRLYHGLILVPGVTASMPGAAADGLVRISSIVGQPLEIPSDVASGQLFLRLGYEDDDYSDNGYWGHDDGQFDQCKNVGDAFVILHITHRSVPPPRQSSVGVYTYHGDNMRLGWNNNETELRSGTVNSSLFGLLWPRPVDGQVYAQPLYAPHVGFWGVGKRNVLIVATEHNSVYAFDADYGVVIWQRNLGPTIPASAVAAPDIEGPEYGITGTPVIDPESQTLYVVTNTLESAPVAMDGEGSLMVYRLHALDLSTGRSREGWPVTIHGSFPGYGGGSLDGQIFFDPKIQLQRAGLLLDNGRVVVTFGSHHDNALSRYHGWAFSYSTAAPATPPLIYNTTPDRRDRSEPNSTPCPDGSNNTLPTNMPAGGGIWQSGYAPASDQTHSIFLETGNGSLTADSGARNVGDSVIRLSAQLVFTPDAANFFAPSNQVQLLVCDEDIGASGAMVVPDQKGSRTPRLLVAGGKDGVLRLLNRDFLGGFTGRTSSQTPDRALQNVPTTGPDFSHAMFCGPAYWEANDGHYVFYTRFADRLQKLRFGVDPSGSGGSQLFPAGASADHFGSNDHDPGDPCPTPVISSNGLSPATGLVWVLRRGDNTLRAYDAETLGLLWSGHVSPGDDAAGQVVKFSLPIVATGRVYIGAKVPISFQDILAPSEGYGQGWVLCFGELPGIEALSQR
jgi:hypothetical protein